MEIKTKYLVVQINLDQPEKGLLSKTTFEVLAGNNLMGNFTFSTLEGCCGVVVSSNSYVFPNYRGLFSQEFHEIKEKVARELGYSLMLSTTQLRNLPQVISAAKARWKGIHTFRNKRTSNDLGLFIKDLT